MIKGVNKNVIEISNTENEYFERAILIVREDKKCLDKDLLTKQANAYIADMSSQKENSVRQGRQAHSIKKKAVLYTLLGVGIAVAAVAAILLFL